MKLIKLSSEHYIVVDDSEIKEGDYGIMDTNNFEIFRCSFYMFPDGSKTPIVPIDSKKITHSTKPIESISVINSIRKGYDKIHQLSLSEVKELLGEVDVDKKAIDYANSFIGEESTADIDYKEGYNQALEDNKDRKYTEEDMRKAMDLYKNTSIPLNDIIQSLQPPTSWDVKYVDGKLKLL